MLPAVQRQRTGGLASSAVKPFWSDREAFRKQRRPRLFALIKQRGATRFTASFSGSLFPEPRSPAPDRGVCRRAIRSLRNPKFWRSNCVARLPPLRVQPPRRLQCRKLRPFGVREPVVSTQSFSGSFPWPSSQSITSKSIPRLSISLSRSTACVFHSGVSRGRFVHHGQHHRRCGRDRATHQTSRMR